MAALNVVLNADTDVERTSIRTPTKCKRCSSGAEALYHVLSDAMDLRVCEQCAAEARRIGLRVEPITPNEDTA